MREEVDLSRALFVLNFAQQKNALEDLRDLVEQGVDIHSLSENDNTLLERLLTHWVQRGENIPRLREVVFSLIRLGFNLDPMDCETTPLIVCAALRSSLCGRGELRIVHALLDNGANLHAVEPYNKENALFCAVSDRMVTLLLERGASVDSMNEGGQTALMLACNNLDCDIVWALLRYKPNLSLRCKFGWTARDYANYTAFSHKDESLAQPVLFLLDTHLEGTAACVRACENERIT